MTDQREASNKRRRKAPTSSAGSKRFAPVGQDHQRSRSERAARRRENANRGASLEEVQRRKRAVTAARREKRQLRGGCNDGGGTSGDHQESPKDPPFSGAAGGDKTCFGDLGCRRKGKVDRTRDVTESCLSVEMEWKNAFSGQEACLMTEWTTTMEPQMSWESRVRAMWTREVFV
ncbi:hypothetical protein Scep_025621 [Stephania cephalantha]|uniref:Uncharacterized protein n=1 Tax=Stephania cephalantha TaxID=152367 RepID=A0AAP0HRC6_9MAGN